jgi:DNA-binding NarL/FixJ family response regulator
MNASIVLKTLKLLKNLIINTPDINTEKLKISLRETKVLEQLGKGFCYTQIAQNLIISPVTFRKNIENIYTKLQVHNKL